MGLGGARAPMARPRVLLSEPQACLQSTITTSVTIIRAFRALRPFVQATTRPQPRAATLTRIGTAQNRSMSAPADGGGGAATTPAVAATTAPAAAAATEASTTVPMDATAAAAAASAAEVLAMSGANFRKYYVAPLDKFMTTKELRKLVEKLGIEYHKCKTTTQWHYGFVYFKDEAQATLSVPKLEGYQVKTRQGMRSLSLRLEANDAEVSEKRKRTMDDDGGGGRDGGGGGGGGGGKWQRTGGDADSESRMKKNALDVVAPLINMPLEQQREQKREALQAVLMKISQASLKARVAQAKQKHNPGPMPAWLAAADVKPGKPKQAAECCPLAEGIAHTATTAAYRNKSEFSVGYERCDEEAKLPVVGFVLGRFNDGIVSVGAPTDCVTCSPEALGIGRVMTEVIRANPAYAPYDKQNHSGFWRMVVVRQGFRTGQVLALIMYSSRGFEKGGVQAELKRMTDTMLAQKDALWSGDAKLSAIYAIENNGMSDVASFEPSEAPLTRMWGEERISEVMNGLTFTLSARAFFQVNTEAAELLYNRVIDAALEGVEESAPVALLDVCCGTGTIGLCAAQRGGAKVAKVFGVESIAAAIEDAKLNSAANGIENCEWVAGTAESKMRTIIQGLPKQMPVIAIVDPPRAGLHQDVIRALRDCNRISRVVYVSCNPKALVENALGLSKDTTGSYRGVPFSPMRAFGVDLFPHTDHVELVTIWERTAEAAAQGKAAAEAKKAKLAKPDEAAALAARQAAGQAQREASAAAAAAPSAAAPPAAAAESQQASQASTEEEQPATQGSFKD